MAMLRTRPNMTLAVQRDKNPNFDFVMSCTKVHLQKGGGGGGDWMFRAAGSSTYTPGPRYKGLFLKPQNDFVEWKANTGQG